MSLSGKFDIETGPSRKLYPTMTESPELRWGFIRKVYVIVTIQLLLTVAGGALVVKFDHPIVRFFSTTTGGLISVDMGFLRCTVLFMLFCFHKSHPLNYVLLAIFTISLALPIGLACSFTHGKVILEAAILTTVMVVSLTLFTFWGAKRGHDFSFLGPFLFAALNMLIVFGLIQIFFPMGKITHMIYGDKLRRLLLADVRIFSKQHRLKNRLIHISSIDSDNEEDEDSKDYPRGFLIHQIYRAHGNVRNHEIERAGTIWASYFIAYQSGIHMSQSGEMGGGCIHVSGNTRLKIWQQEGEVTNFKAGFGVSCLKSANPLPTKVLEEPKVEKIDDDDDIDLRKSKSTSFISQFVAPIWLEPGTCSRKTKVLGKKAPTSTVLGNGGLKLRLPTRQAARRSRTPPPTVARTSVEHTHVTAAALTDKPVSELSFGCPHYKRLEQ
ncbi:bax inhibitor-1 family protein [Artemisia annua]|uniref:Bax inhibitor-1 family protein n=1 Tax=Artemisia annua TaxID=35608 RepID=A0A2U1MW06_ARTAN|nr:bax inhibitor-1 family protein [Artemisia annua]